MLQIIGFEGYSSGKTFKFVDFLLKNHHLGQYLCSIILKQNLWTTMK